MRQKIEESIKFIRSTTNIAPRGLLILGTGLADVVGEMDEMVTIPYSQIPHFHTVSAPTHTGDLIIGRTGGYPLAVMNGRLHYYEGYSMTEVTYPIRVLHSIGVGTMVVTNAAGGLNVDYQSGDIVLITDHINLMGESPLRGSVEPESDSMFPLMNQAYDPHLAGLFSSACTAEKIQHRRGIYLAVAGPNLETPAELRFFRAAGADLVGMSTVPEVLVAVHLGIRVLGISVVSNTAVFCPGTGSADPIGDIKRTAKTTCKSLARILKRLFKELADEKT